MLSSLHKCHKEKKCHNFHEHSQCPLINNIEKFWDVSHLLPSPHPQGCQHWHRKLQRGQSTFPVFVRAHRIFLQNSKKYWNSRVLAECFVMGCEHVVVLGIYRNSHGKSAVSQIVGYIRLKSGSWQPCSLPPPTLSLPTLETSRVATYLSSCDDSVILMIPRWVSFGAITSSLGMTPFPIHKWVINSSSISLIISDSSSIVFNVQWSYSGRSLISASPVCLYQISHPSSTKRKKYCFGKQNRFLQLTLLEFLSDHGLQ